MNQATAMPGKSKLVAAWLAAWFVYLVADFWGHAVLLSHYWRDTAQFWRPAAELFKLIPVGYLSFAIYCGALVWLLARLGGEKQSALRGARFGAVAGLVFGSCTWIGLYSVIRLPLAAVTLFTLWGILESALSGAAAGSVLVAERPWRKVGWIVLLGFICFVIAVVVQNLFFPSGPQLKLPA